MKSKKILGYFIIAMLISLFVGCGPKDKQGNYDKAVDRFCDASDIKYETQNKFNYPDETKQKVEVSMRLALNLKDGFDDYKGSSIQETVVYQDEEKTDYSTESFYQASEDGFFSITKVEDEWVKTVYTEKIKRPKALVAYIRNAFKTSDNVENIESESGSFYRISENKEDVCAFLEEVSFEHYKQKNYINFENYAPFYLDVWIDNQEGIAKIDYSKSGFAYVTNIYTGSIIKNADKSFRDFVEQEAILYNIDYNADEVELPEATKTNYAP